MTITARFPGKCRKCGGRIEPGQKINWDKQTRAVEHIECPTRQAEKTTAAKAKPQYEFPTYNISGGSGYGCMGWQKGDVVRNTPNQVKQGEPEFLYVLTAKSTYVDEDGMSFGVGDEEGYIYQATCREATEEEAKPVQERIEAKQRQKKRGVKIKEIAADIREEGERPEGTNDPEGDVINIGKGQTPYGGGEWFVIGSEWIWYVQNNGSDGDDWSRNNVRTGGAGAIGWRVKHSKDLEQRIRG